MKKSYVKPVMESELFVANEYIAACYVVWCNTNQTCTHWEHALIPGVDRNPTKPHYDNVLVKNVASADDALVEVVGKQLTDDHKKHKYYHNSDRYMSTACDTHTINVRESHRPNASD